jgi:hypothetical protein
MAQAAIELLGDESKLRMMGKRSRQAAQAKFCASRIIPKYEEFYKLVVERTS